MSLHVPVDEDSGLDDLRDGSCGDLQLTVCGAAEGATAVQSTPTSLDTLHTRRQSDLYILESSVLYTFLGRWCCVLEYVLRGTGTERTLFD